MRKTFFRKLYIFQDQHRVSELPNWLIHTLADFQRFLIDKHLNNL